MLEEELARCRKQIQMLREENDQLRRASFAFGALADRLNDALRETRRAHGTDVRGSASSFSSTRGK
jgi:transposase-like protein